MDRSGAGGGRGGRGEERRGGGGGGGRQEEAGGGEGNLHKSNNPHLAGGEKSKFRVFRCVFVV